MKLIKKSNYPDSMKTLKQNLLKSNMEGEVLRVLLVFRVRDLKSQGRDHKQVIFKAVHRGIINSTKQQ